MVSDDNIHFEYVTEITVLYRMKYSTSQQVYVYYFVSNSRWISNYIKKINNAIPKQFKQFGYKNKHEIKDAFEKETTDWRNQRNRTTVIANELLEVGA